jgi:hypothetical protein
MSDEQAPEEHEADATREPLASPAGGPFREDVSEQDIDGEPVPASHMADIHSEVRRQFELVPEIGTKWRWYDIPYRMLRWFADSRVVRRMPWQVRHVAYRGMNFMMSFDHYERLKIERLDNPMDNLIVDPAERVTQGGLWVIEFFPPSQYSRLIRALRQNEWDKEKMFSSFGGSNAEQVTEARRGRGFTWARIGSVASPNSGYLLMDGKREKLPPEFAYIEISAVQIGQSLTAVVAFIRLSEQGSQSLNNVWHATHEPYFEWRGLSRPIVESRYFSAIRATQNERNRLHDLARSWLSDQCSGFFADSDSGQPVVDFNLFAVHDPLARAASPRGSDALRALSMANQPFRTLTSPDMKGCVLIPGEALRQSERRLKNCWGIVGNFAQVEELNDQIGYGNRPFAASTLAAMLNDAVRSFLLYTAVTEYQLQLRAAYSSARDTARVRHQRFKPRQIEKLSQELLTSSLDLPVVSRDLSTLWESGYRRWNGISVAAEPVPTLPHPEEQFDYIEWLGELREQTFQRLLEEDAAYRDVLSTVASLGSSAGQTRVGNRALLVAVASLVVSLVALLIAAGQPSLAQQLWGWLQGK